MTLLNVAQIIASIILVLIILSQVREAGSGMFGSAQNTIRTRRGLERTMFQLTIVMIVIFLVVSTLSARFPVIIVIFTVARIDPKRPPIALRQILAHPQWPA